MRLEDGSSWTRRLATYGIAGAAAAALASPAQAGIIYKNPTIKPFVSHSGSYNFASIDLELNDDGVVDYSATAAIIPPILTPISFEARTHLDGMNGNSVVSWHDGAAFQEYAIPIAAGLTVGPTVNLDPLWASRAEWADFSVLYQAKAGSQPLWPNNLNDPRYAGLQFHASDGMHFGWMLVGTSTVFEPYDVTKMSAQMEIYSWAYESRPNTPIVVGATESEVPEPSTLALYALGAAGIAMLKQRRRPTQS